MEYETVRCPECGGDAKVRIGKYESYCPSCGAKLYLKKATAAVSAEASASEDIHYIRELKKWKIVSGAIAALSFLCSIGTWISSALGEVSILSLFIGGALFIGGPIAIGCTEPLSSEMREMCRQPSRGKTILKWYAILFLLGVIGWAAGMFAYGMNRSMR